MFRFCGLLLLHTVQQASAWNSAKYKQTYFWLFLLAKCTAKGQQWFTVLWSPWLIVYVEKWNSHKWRGLHNKETTTNWTNERNILAWELIFFSVLSHIKYISCLNLGTINSHQYLTRQKMQSNQLLHNNNTIHNTVKKHTSSTVNTPHSLTGK